LKCHYTYDEKGERFFIPECYGTIHTLDMEDCHCTDYMTFEKFEKKIYNEELKNRNRIIADMESEIKHLHKVIQGLKLKTRPIE